MGLTHYSSSSEPWEIGSLIAEFERHLDIDTKSPVIDDYKPKLQTRDNQRIKDLSHLSPLAIVVTEPHAPFAILYANDVWLKLCGFDSLEEVKGKTLSIIQGQKTDKELLKQLKSSVMRCGEFEVENLINYTKDKKPFRNHLRIKPFKGEGDETLFLVGIMSVDEYLPPKALLSERMLEETKARKTVNFNNRIGVILIPARREYFNVGLNQDLWYCKHDYPDFAESALQEIQDFKKRTGNENLSVEQIMKVIY